MLLGSIGWFYAFGRCEQFSHSAMFHVDYEYYGNYRGASYADDITKGFLDSNVHQHSWSWLIVCLSLLISMLYDTSDIYSFIHFSMHSIFHWFLHYFGRIRMNESDIIGVSEWKHIYWSLMFMLEMNTLLVLFNLYN